MHLFISNFRYNFIVQCMLFFTLLIFFYTLCVSYIDKNLIGNNQWQTNIIKAQVFFFEEKSNEIVMVGSSMLYNIPLEKRSDQVFNLAFAGDAANTGLLLILKREHVKMVLIEANPTIMRGIDRKLINKTDEIFRYLPFLKEINRPDVVFIQGIRYLRDNLRNSKKNITGVCDKDKPVATVLEPIQKEMSIQFNEYVLQERLNEIHGMVLELQKRNIEVFFVEPPMDKSLYESKRVVQVRKALLEIFPQDKYRWIFSNWDEYKTNDGIHLGKSSANRYADFLLGCIGRKGENKN